MRLITNSVDPTEVITENRNGDEYLIIKSVPFLRSQKLSGGYVPERSVKQTANKWSNVPLTANHPRNENGKPVAAQTKIDEVGVGSAENARYDGEYVRVDMAINADRARAMGGEAARIVEKIGKGETFDVSSQYVANELPPGTYDGQEWEQVEEIDRPDSIALLPGKKGQCSVEDGCGINPQMVANAAVSITASDDAVSPERGQAEAGGMTNTMQANQVDYTTTDVTPEEVDSYTDEEWDGDAAVAAMPNPSESDEAANVLDETHMLVPQGDEARDSKANWKLPFRTSADSPVNTRALVAIDAALSGARGGVEGVSQEQQEAAQELTQAFLVDAPDDLFGSVDAENGEMQDNSLTEQVVNFLAGIRGTAQPANEPAESGVDTANGSADPDGDNDTMDREKYIEEITANSPLTEAALEERCKDGLEKIHADVMEANEDTEDTTDVTDNDDDVIELTESELDNMIRDKVEQVTANKQTESQKEELASEIVANSAEYESTDAVLEDYPTEAALETKKDDVAPDAGAAFSARGATTANTSQVDDYPDMDFGGD